MKFNEFWKFTKTTAKDAVISYFAPLKTIVAFFAIPFELFRIMFVSLSMNSDEYARLQDIKMVEEELEMTESQDVE